MSAPSLTTTHARLGLRLLALYFVLEGLWQLATNLLASFAEFDPNYLGFYFRSQLASPLLGVLLGVAVFLLSGRLARWILGADRA